MTIDHLREFVLLSEVGNFSEAADILFVSQATLSRHIKQLEEEIGSSLFYRTTRKTILTPEGNFLLEYAKSIVGIYMEFLQGFPDMASQKLLVDVLSTISVYGVAEMLAAFSKRHPNIVIQLRENQTAEHMSSAPDISFRMEIHTENVRPTSGSTQRILITTDKLGVLLPPNSPFSGRDNLRLDEVADQNLVWVPKSYFQSHEMLRKKRLLYNGPISNVGGLVAAGLGIAILSYREALRQQSANPTIGISVLDSPLLANYYLTYDESRLKSVGHLFIAFAKEYLGKLNATS